MVSDVKTDEIAKFTNSWGSKICWEVNVMIGCTEGFTLSDSLDCAVGHMIAEMSLRERVMLARLENRQASLLGKLLIEYVRLQLKELSLGQVLLEDCRTKTGKAAFDEAEAAVVIVTKVWSRLRETYRLRVVC
jgi:hypothetical protein